MKKFCLVVALIAPALAAQQSSYSYEREASSSARQQQNGKPYLGSYAIEESCQYELCGSRFAAEFAPGSVPARQSCSGDCDSLASRLISSKYEKETLWVKCSDMCADKGQDSAFR